MNNNNINHEGMWLKAKLLFPTCANHDEGILELENELLACCDSRGDGLPKYGCWFCPYQVACERIWEIASAQSSVRKLLPDEVKRFKERFALIKGG